MDWYTFYRLLHIYRWQTGLLMRRYRAFAVPLDCTHEGRWSTGPDGGPSVCANCGTIRVSL